MTTTVLLVEDEDDNRDLLSRALERAGYRCRAAASRSAALELAGDGFLDLVVTDIVLGREDRGGLQLLSDLRKRGIGAPVIVITAFADVERLKAALNLGAAHLLEKPFSTPELLTAIERALAHGGDAAHAAEQVLSRANLTEKERVVARHLLEGHSSSEIALLLENSPKTIRQHVSQIYAKCGVGSRAEFFRLVYARGGREAS